MLRMICVLTTLAMTLSLTATIHAQPTDTPAELADFKGEVTGKVKWIHKSGYWFVLIPGELKPAEGAAADFEALKGKEIKTGIGAWVGKGQPKPELAAFVASLKPNQQVTLTVEGDKTSLRFNDAPKPERVGELSEVDAPGSVAGSSARRPVPEGRTADVADLSERYTWDNVPVGGGGYSVGMVFHPQVEGLVYARTDVAGALRRDPGDERWSILTQNTFSPEHGRVSGSAGLATHPVNPDLIWSAFGGDGASEGIWFSDRRGERWQRVLGVRVDPNAGNARKYGDALVADPNNGDVLYYISQQDGLYRTTTGGRSNDAWEQIASQQVPPNPDPRSNSRSIVVDPSETVVVDGEARSRRVYVAAGEGQVYRSDDGGQSFAKLPAISGGGTIRWMSGANNGDVYAAHANGIVRWTPGASQWEDVTPPAGGGSAVAVHPRNADHLLALARPQGDFGGQGDALWRSRDRGRTWEQPGFKRGSAPPAGFDPFAAACAVFFDPHHAGVAYHNDAFSIWRTEDVWADTVTWDAEFEGHEETIAIAMTSLPEPGARLLGGFADIRGFTWMEHTDRPGERIPWMRQAPVTNLTSFGWSPANPRVVYAASRGPKPSGQTGQSGGGGNVIEKGGIGAFFRSTDGGKSWDAMTEPFRDTPFALQQAGGPKLAVSATDPDTVVYVQVSGGFRRTTDGGKTWHDVGIAADDAFVHNQIAYDFRHVLEADQVDGEVFYAYRFANGGEFYRSTDGGKTFAKVASASEDLPLPLDRAGGDEARYSGSWGLKVAAAPGLEGELWISLAGSGVFRAAGDPDAGHRTDRFERIAYFDQAGPTNVAFGKAAPGSDVPTVFVFGKRAEDGRWGAYRSTDLGETWAAITPEHRPGQWIRNMTGDMQQFGTVYLTDASFGISAGRFNETPTP